MSKHVISHTFDQAALDKLIENHLSFYKSREATHSQRGAVEYVSVDSPTQMLHAYAEKISAGYTLHESFPVNAHMMNGTGFYSFYVVKPAHMQAEDIAAITAEVTAEYNEQRLAAYEAHKQMLIAESLAMAKRAAEKKAAEAEAKLVAQAAKDAEQALGVFE
ncbi:hypothetical protein UYA_09560 [Ectopseudomonas alcaliphila JAB1]|nr:hypothetical protein [Pseudomonas alcaliphila]APU29964.1 hypothetical protein UYA_09560 [Pseudomonas alcaliphila JAB1]